MIRQRPSELGKLIDSRYEIYQGWRSLDGFQKTKWGMTTKDVKKLYPKAKEETDSLSYSDKVAGYPSTIRYAFLYRRLVAVDVQFDGSDFAADVAIKRYEDISNVLSEKYGRYEILADTSSSDVDSKVDEPYAVSQLYLLRQQKERRRQWNTETTAITMMLTWEGLEMKHLLRYESKAFASKFRE